MLFPSITFLFYFLPLFFLLYCAAPGILAKNIVLIAFSLDVSAQRKSKKKPAPTPQQTAVWRGIAGAVAGN